MPYKIGLPIGHGENTYDVKGSKGIADDPTTPERGDQWEEFWFNEKVGKHAYYRLLEHGFDVILPQKWDENEKSLQYKSDMVNRENTDLNVCIHANAGPAGAEGACIFYWNGSEGGKLFAHIWKENFEEMCPEQGIHGNGIHISQRGSWTNFHMIRETEAVTDLIEHGFFTTPEQLENLKNPDFQERCAEVIVKSVCQYFGVDYHPIKEENRVKKPEEIAAQREYEQELRDAIDFLQWKEVSDGSRLYESSKRSQEMLMIYRYHINVVEKLANRIHDLEEKVKELTNK